MLFRLIQGYARLAIKIYCRKIIINKPEYLKEAGPLLLASNHPNSFLDGMIMTTLFEEHVYSLARGDAFKKNNVNKFLRWLRLLPVYRTSEGVENLAYNYDTFAACIEVFKKKGIVLIFSEGLCINEWHLRPLKKGSARLAISAWAQNIPLKILPVGFNYSSFKSYGKDVHINFGNIFSKEIIQQSDTQGTQFLTFNTILQKQLQELVYEIDSKDLNAHQNHFPDNISPVKRILLFLPSVIGVLVHLPFFIIVKFYTDMKFKNSGHYDSVMTSLLMLLYPFYILLIAILMATYSLWAGLVAILFLPLAVWCFTQINYRLIPE
ncbi:MAG: 1-acyl-sn-glycerol-3-phosphate acyltransferase [Chitinophagaceae bacterium]